MGGIVPKKSKDFLRQSGWFYVVFTSSVADERSG